MMNEEPTLHFILEEDNEAAKWRKRALFLLAVMLEMCFVSVLGVLSGWIQRHERLIAVETETRPQHEQTTFLVMPPDLEKELRKPKTNILSDKNRLAHGPSPVVKPNGLTMPYMRGNTHLPKLAGGAPPRKKALPPSPVSPAPPKTETAQAQKPPQPKPPAPAPKPKIMLSDVTPPPKPDPELAARLGIQNPEDAIQQSMREVARGRSTGAIPGLGDSPEQLNNLNPNFSTSGPIILSDTRGVDFGPYLAQILMIVRNNWYAVIPEAARLGEQGRCSIVFDIQKDGSVPQSRLELVSSSGKRPLDLAAISGIRSSVPFPPLPAAFTGNHLLLQFNFYYNMNP
jgi:TonB family protein